ncbi:hypothetical protein T484DRAFT_1928911 [Baffinella frigidus]|nr:hypothetical protein T484DRAFT_1928911 [Cryptophyta sp. CCMP2293]
MVLSGADFGPEVLTLSTPPSDFSLPHMLTPSHPVHASLPRLSSELQQLQQL